RVAHLFFRCVEPVLVVVNAGQALAVRLAEQQIAAEVLLPIGAARDAQKVDDLDEEERLAVAAALDRVDEALQAREEAIVADAQEWSRGDIADAGGFDDDDAG